MKEKTTEKAQTPAWMESEEFKAYDRNLRANQERWFQKKITQLKTEAEAKEQSTLHERDIMNKCPEYNNDLAAMLGVNREDYVAKANRIREDTRALRERMFPPHEDKGDQGIGEQPGPRRI